MQRSREESTISVNESSKRQRLLAAETFLLSPLFVYSFLIPLLLEFLDHHDVLTRCVLLCKNIKPYLLDYRLTYPLDFSEARTLSAWHRYLPIQPTFISDWFGEMVRSFTNLKILTFDSTFDDPLDQGDLPLSLESIVFGDSFDQPISNNVLPSHLTMLDVGHSWNQTIWVNVLPSKLIKLVTGLQYNQPLKIGALPNSLLTLNIGDGFNQTIEPSVLTHSLTELSLGLDFNQQFFPGVLPSSLKILSIGNTFNNSLDFDIMPPLLEQLTLGKSFAKTLYLPKSLSTLSLASSIHRIQFVRSTEKNKSVVAGPFDHDFLIRGRIKQMLIGIVNFCYQACDVLPFGILPDSITHLSLGNACNQPIIPGFIPNSVTHLTFGTKFNQLLIQNCIPDSVTHLLLSGDFNQLLIPGALPRSLKYLLMDRDNCKYNQPLVIVNIDSPSGQKISFGSIPDSVTHLTFSRDFAQSIEMGVLPDSITHLAFGQSFVDEHPFLGKCSLPKSLQQLHGYVNFSEAIMSMKEIIICIDEGDHLLWWPKFKFNR